LAPDTLVKPMSAVERIEQVLADASLDQHGEAIMNINARRPGYAAQLLDWLNARAAPPLSSSV
jgi:hypothetical protein